ncbi:ferritin-like domain-containing protein [Sphaerisporangium sp. B11E5]|uniref:ferritin-like domain-containing protein n=1 Tax=Sphaerisporangium sp. B11E5 TaxID=3153563 RepID=UPI00325ED0D2
MAEFLTDIQTLRDRAREEIDKGPVTEAAGADLPRVVQVCNEALATEIVCVLRYKRHYYTAGGVHAGPVAREFLEHATDEQRHADMLADRIAQLGGQPDFDPARLSTRAHIRCDAGQDLVEMIREDLVAERVAIASYTEIAQWLGDGDPITRRVFEQLLADEEDHADDLADLLQRLPRHRADAAGPA